MKRSGAKRFTWLFACCCIFVSACTDGPKLDSTLQLSEPLNDRGPRPEVDIIKLIQFTENSHINSAIAVKELANCEKHDDLNLIPFEDASPQLTSDSTKIKVSSGYIKKLIDAALEVEFSDAQKARALIAKNDLRVDTSFLPRSQRRHFIFSPNIGGEASSGQKARLDYRLVNYVVVHVCSTWVFSIFHERGHQVKNHHSRPIKTCDQYHSVEFEADQYAAFRSNVVRMWNRDNGFGVVNAGIVATSGAPDIDFGLSYPHLGLGEDSALANCKYPTAEERASRVKSFVDGHVVEKRQDRLVAVPRSTKGERSKPRPEPSKSQTNEETFKFDRLPGSEHYRGFAIYKNVVSGWGGNVIASDIETYMYDTLDKCIDHCKSQSRCIAVNFKAPRLLTGTNKVFGNDCVLFSGVHSWRTASGMDLVIIRSGKCGGGKLPC